MPDGFAPDIPLQHQPSLNYVSQQRGEISRSDTASAPNNELLLSSKADFTATQQMMQDVMEMLGVARQDSINREEVLRGEIASAISKLKSNFRAPYAS